LASAFLPAQGVQWVIDTWGGVYADYHSDYAAEMAVTGSVEQPPILQGADLSCGTPTEKPFVARYHPDGSLMWARCFPSGQYSSGQRVLMGPAATVYVLGRFNDSLSIDGQRMTSVGISDIFLCKFNISGTLEWMRQIGSTDEGAYSMALNHLGGVTVCGSSHFPAWFDTLLVTAPTYDPFYLHKDFVAQYDASGNLNWVKVGQTHGMQHKLHVDAQGNTYLAGSYQQLFYWENDSMPSNSEDVFILKLDTAGHRQWLRRLTTNSFESVSELVGLRNGDLYLMLSSGGVQAGATILYGDPDSLQPTQSLANLDGIKVVRIGADGDWHWMQDYEGPVGSPAWRSVRLIKDNADSLHLFAEEGAWIDTVLNLYGLRHMEIGSNGNVQLSNRLDSILDLEYIAIDAWHNAYLYGGYSDSVRLGTFMPTSPSGVYAFYLAKLGLNVSAAEPSTSTLSVKAFPNPARDVVEIQLATPQTAQWQLYDLQGRRLAQGECRDGRAQLTLAPYASGMYLLHVQAGGRRAVLRLVRE
jgi:hypothetical protein